MSKELFNEIREAEISATMDESTFREIPESLKERMKIKSIEFAWWRSEYEKDPEWKEKQKALSEAIKERKQREDEIRAGFKAE